MKLVMSIFVLASLVLFVGCACQSGNTALTTWHSSTASSEEKARAVEKLVPLGVSREQAVSILGKADSWGHCYGGRGSFYENGKIIPWKDLGFYDYWALGYSTGSNTCVELHFKTVGDKLEFTKVVSGIILSNTPVAPN